MDNYLSEEKDYLTEFIKLAQYITNITVSQNVWDELGKFIPRTFGADFVSFVKQESDNLWDYTSLVEKSVWSTILTEILDSIRQVRETGFLATEAIAIPKPYSLLLVPIQEGRTQIIVMVVGYQTQTVLAKKLLNLYLGIAGLAGNIISRISYEEELQTSSSRLEKLVKERTAKLNMANQELIEANRKLIQTSSIDGLTGIANRRYFEQYMTKQCSQAKRTGFPLAVVLIDIDYFKFYNDTYGHLAGDDCLKKVAKSLEQSLFRPTDLVARFGGEEFIVILSDTDHVGALEVAERLRYDVEKMRILHEGSQVSEFVTVSVGVCVSDSLPEDYSCDEQIRIADKALYEAKHAGRNQVMVVK